MARRSKGEGSVYRRASDGRWAATWQDSAGKRRTSYGATKSAATRARDAARLADQQQAKQAARAAVPTVGAWMTQWLRDWKAPGVEATTLANYESWLARLRADALWTQPLDGPRLDAWQAFLVGIYPTAPAMALNLRRILVDAYNVAVAAELISVNIVARTRLPRHRPERASLSAEQCAQLLQHVAGHRLEIAIWLGLCGLRRGELCGLRWAHIDGDQAHIQEQRIAGETRKPKGQKLRTVTLPPQVVTALERHRERQRREALTNARPAPETVLTNTRGGQLRPSTLNTWYAAQRDALGLPGTLHSLRRTSATIAQAAGANLRDVLQQLGHANLDTTLLYTDSTEAGRRDAAERLGRVLPWPGERSA